MAARLARGGDTPRCAETVGGDAANRKDRCRSREEGVIAHWVIVAAGFHELGGMERANLAVARFLARRGDVVELVGHSFEPGLRDIGDVRVHEVPRPGGSFLLGEGLLARRGVAVVDDRVRRDPAVRVIVNGGNCPWGDVNWVHYVHHAWQPSDPGAPLWFRAKNKVLNVRGRRAERAIIPKARLAIANSELTRKHLMEELGVAGEKVRTVYLGSDPRWGEPSAEERRAARAWLQIDADRPVVAFVGALGYDRRKGFDTVLQAWLRLGGRPGWDGVLVAAGGGRGLDVWRARVTDYRLQDSVRMLGFTDRVATLLAASDVLISPVRYEPYGLNVQEAICRGLPAIVSRAAGIAERYPPELAELLLDDAEDAGELADKLAGWAERREEWRERVKPFGAELRGRDWDTAARDLVAAAESA